MKLTVAQLVKKLLDFYGTKSLARVHTNPLLVPSTKDEPSSQFNLIYLCLTF
jgi:hypothetical protein